MSSIGAEGRGESVWLGWFLGDVLRGLPIYANIAVIMNGRNITRIYARQLADSLNEQGWDGQWYRSAFTDGGQWLGSIHNAECRIDAIAQSWSVISGWRRKIELCRQCAHSTGSLWIGACCRAYSVLRLSIRPNRVPAIFKVILPASGRMEANIHMALFGASSLGAGLGMGIRRSSCSTCLTRSCIPNVR